MATDSELAQTIWDYMRLEHPLEKADCIFGLGSDDIRIAEHAANLYLRGYAPHILFSGGLIKGRYKYFDTSEAEAFSKRAVELGVPEGAILKEEKATNTGENITNSYELIRHRDLKVKCLILVQKPFMLRRTYATFMKQWPSFEKPKIITSAVDLTFVDYINDDRYDFNRTVNIMTGDLQRIIEYPKLGFQIEQYMPPEVAHAYEELVRRGYTKNLI